MARDHARINLTIWTDPDFRDLPPAAQHLYLTLWTAPELSYCGVHDWRPARMTGLSRGYSAEHIETVAACLEARHFLVIDRDTEECLVRSWARFDGLMKQPRMAISLITAYAGTGSQTIRQVLVYELCKIRDESPELSCWADQRVLEVLEHPAISAKELPVPFDPFEGDFAPGLDMGLPQTQPKVWGSVCTPSTPAPAPAPNSIENPATGVAVRDERFDEFWAAYPRKTDKAKARTAYAKALKSNGADFLIDAATRYAAAQANTELRYTLHPTTWLNGKRWEDDLGNVTQLRQQPAEWFQPFRLPECPADIADDPARYEAWAEGKRQAWQAGERW